MSSPDRNAVRLIHSRHRLLIEEELQKIRERISEKVDPDFNMDVFEAGEHEVEAILQSAETLPLASEHRYVIVKECQRLSPTEIKRLERYVGDPAESAYLILAAVGLKRNSPLIRLIGKWGRVRELERRKDQVPGWIRARFKERDLEVSGKAIAYIQEALGDDLMAIEGAVEKVSLYHEGEGPVELDEVVSLVEPSGWRSIYELMDRVALGDTDQSIKLLRRLLKQGERPTYILYALSRHYRNLLTYGALREEGRQESDILACLKIPRNQAWMVTRKLKPQAARLDEGKLRRALELLMEMEMGIKTGTMEEDFAVEMAVTGLSGLAGGGMSPRQPGEAP